MKVLTAGEGTAAVALARQALEAGVKGDRLVPPVLPDVFYEKRGVFVTLTEGGILRGCIGLPYPVMPLGEAIAEAAVSAALQDPRFPPVMPRDLPKIRVEVTVLSVPEPLAGPPGKRDSCVRVGVHGLIVQGRGRSGLLLPQVATEYRWTACEFLDHTCIKAGLPPGTWKSQGVQVLGFEGQIFHEPEP
ncbi:MAG: TIGR00296 family protein [Methanomicrobiales archaeon]|nr:TIGR00296 family protein [Methanomicrobiales archaeon]